MEKPHHRDENHYKLKKIAPLKPRMSFDGFCMK